MEKSQRIVTDAEPVVRFNPFYSSLFFTPISSAIRLILSLPNSQLNEELRFYNVPSPKEPAPKARHPMVNSDASPHVNRLARPPRFPEIFEGDERALDHNRCQSPTLVTLRKKPRSTSSA